MTADRLPPLPEIVAQLRERRKLRYIGDCKCGSCQLVPADLLDQAIFVIDAIARNPDARAGQPKGDVAGWQSDAPEVAGWYWTRPRGTQMESVTLVERHGSLLVHSASGRLVDSDRFANTEWLGPITPTPAKADAAMWLPPDGAYLVRFDDAERKDRVFVGCGAREGALRYYREASIQWNAHLFVKVDSNSRDCKTPNAQADADLVALLVEARRWIDTRIVPLTTWDRIDAAITKAQQGVSDATAD